MRQRRAEGRQSDLAVAPPQALPFSGLGNHARNAPRGEPLSCPLRRLAEQTMGVDLAGVRVHTDGAAQLEVRRAGARALAVGDDILLGAGVRNDANPIAAHEVAHAAQQRRAPSLTGGVARRGAAEQDADAAALAMLGGMRHTPTPVGRAQVSAFDSFEHVKVGERAGPEAVRLHGEAVTAGELNALGDFFGSAEEILSAPKERFLHVLGLVRRQVRDTAPMNTAECDAATGGAYLTLAMDNDAHFAPSDPRILPSVGAAPATNIATWEAGFRRAAAFAREAGAMQPGDPGHAEKVTEALVHAGFADHFLTDAFAAGHLFNKEDLMVAQRDLLDHVGDGLFTTDEWFFDGVAAEVIAKERAVCAEYAISWLAGGPLDDVDALGTVLETTYDERPEVILNALVHHAHDQLNAGGVEVSSAAQDEKWLLMGDRSSESVTEDAASDALAVPRAAIRALLAGGEVDIDATVFEVHRHIPHPTAAGMQRLHEVMAGATDPEVGMMHALSEEIVHHIRDVLDALVKESGGAVWRRDGTTPLEPTWARDPDDLRARPQPLAQDVPPDGCVQYEVQPGDTLWAIAVEHYQDGSRARSIFEANRHRIDGFDSPDRVLPGWTLELP